MYVSIDLVEEVIERQLRKYKNKLIARQQEGGNFQSEFFEAEQDTSNNDEIKIIRTKRLESSLCSQKTHVFRWNFLDMIFMYSVTQSLTR